MKSSVERSLYHECLQRYSVQTNRQGWRWIDSHHGDETLIILPGFMGEAETSFLYVLALALHLRVISVSYPPTIGQVNKLCDSFCDFLDELNIVHTTVLGGSSGGFLAQVFLRRLPGRFSACILTHTGLPSFRRARTAHFFLRLFHHMPFRLLQWLMQASVYAFFPRPTSTHAFWRAHFREVIRRQTKTALTNRFALMEDFHSQSHFHVDDLATWSGKLLLMEMLRDPLTTPDEQAALRALYPNARLHVFAESAHYDSVEQPDGQIRVIKEFMQSKVAQRSSKKLQS